MSRVRERPRSIGKYTGTIGELKASMEKYGDHNFSLYNLVIDTSSQSSHEVAQEIQGELSK
jgi:chloramphenicol 3-O-phosphotransferase